MWGPSDCPIARLGVPHTSWGMEATSMKVAGYCVRTKHCVQDGGGKENHGWLHVTGRRFLFFKHSKYSLYYLFFARLFL
jgi:hypothetical protein